LDADDTSVVSGVSNSEEFNVGKDKENEILPSPSDILLPLIPKR
jgi:hypothetical protein